MTTAPKPRVSYAEYAKREASSETKHEYFDGEVFAMAGGTPEHAELAMRVGAALGRQLADRTCRVYSSDLRVHVPATGLGAYPDVSVVCGPLERDPEDENAITNPTVVLEILSDATEAFDRGDKFASYRALSSLREYVLVSQKRPRVEVFARASDGRWVLTTAGPGESVTLASIGCVLEVDAVYGDMFG